MAVLQDFPGYSLYEYMLVVNPHEDLRNRIQQIKQDFASKYDNKTAQYSKAHLCLVQFKQYEMAEQRILNRLKTIAMGCPPIKIELKDYGSFPTHSLFIQVTSKLPIEALVKTIRTQAQKLLKADNDHKPLFIMQPNFTIARKLQPWQYEKGWNEYSHRHFTGRFIADAMLLLKRKEGEKNYQIACRFEFQNLPVSITQGALFS